MIEKVTMFQQGEKSYDITLLCMSAIGLILLVGYIAFSYFVTHRGDFYHIRRWKASIWLASIFGGILGVPVFLLSIAALIASSSAKNIFEIIGVIIGGFLSIIAFILPFVFMVCIGTHHRLKWWFNSDDYLDKIWKDPNKGYKSPIQDI
jgi:hypothetical protein